MIKITQEATYIAGELGDIATEFSIGLRALYKQMKDNMGEEKANFILSKIGRCAVSTEEELKAEMEKLMND